MSAKSLENYSLDTFYVATLLWFFSGLAISDLGCLSTTIWFSISFTPAVAAADVPFDVPGVAYLIGALPHLSFSRITSWITAIITLERCLCIILPLKVKKKCDIPIMGLWIFRIKTVSLFLAGILIMSLLHLYIISLAVYVYEWTTICWLSFTFGFHR